MIYDIMLLEHLCKKQCEREFINSYRKSLCDFPRNISARAEKLRAAFDVLCGRKPTTDFRKAASRFVCALSDCKYSMTKANKRLAEVGSSFRWDV